MKKFITVFIAMLVLLSCLPLGISAADTEVPVYVTASAQNGESTKISPTDNIFYLPSAVDVTKLSLASESGSVAYKNADGTFSGSLTAGETLDLTKAKTQDERGAECYKLKLTAGGKSADFTFYSDSSLPSVFISTAKGLAYIESNKENRDKDAKILVIDEDGNVEYSDIAAESTSEIKLRGNATAGYYKKPYQIKLDAKTALLGMDKSKTWILLANYTDQSSLHNALAWEMGSALGLDYNIEYRFTNLYVDGEYLGLYIICEKVQIDSNRVDIEELEKANEKANEGVDLESLAQQTVSKSTLINNTILSYYQYTVGVKSPEDITGGYLVELDNNYGTDEPSHFVTENGNVYVVKSPEFASKEEMEYIARLFADMEEAIYSDTGYNSRGKHYSEYIDMESFAGVYTVQELMKNWDAYTSSIFFYKDADKNGEQAKIYCGPLWDLDNTLGNINFNKDFGTDTAYLWAQFGEFSNYHRGFAKNLMEHEDFQEVTANCFATLYDAVKGYLAEGGWLQEISEKIYSSVMMDRTRWEMYNSDRWLLNRYGYKSSVKFVWFAEYGAYDDTESDTALGFLRYYLSSRAEALKYSIGTVGYDEPTNGGTPSAVVTTSATATTSTSKTTAQTAGTSASSTTIAVGTENPPAEKPKISSNAIAGIVITAVCIAAIGTLAVIAVKKKK